MKRILYVLLICVLFSCEENDTSDTKNNIVKIPEEISINDIISAIETGDSIYNGKQFTISGFLYIRHHIGVRDCVGPCESEDTKCIFRDTNAFITRSVYECPGERYGIHEYEKEYKKELNILLSDKIVIRNSCTLYYSDYPVTVSGTLHYEHAYLFKDTVRYRSADLVLDSVSTDLIINKIPCRDNFD